MERKHFLKNGLAALGIAAIAPLANACKKDTSPGSSGSSSGSDSSSGSCTVTPAETEGPFPTKSPSTLLKSDITGDRTGVAFTIKIYIKNKNNSCAALSGALVDIWHCDKDGYYSEYGGTSMQTVDYTSVHFNNKYTMHKALIRLCYCKIIDVHSVKTWDKFVFEDTYTEFLMQAQFYNQEKKYTTFSELVAHAAGAEKLHFLVSAAVIGYLQQLNGKVPDLLNNLGRLFAPFKQYRFEIINSNIKDKSKHQVAINFFSEPLAWHDTINNQLLVSVPGNTENGEILTDLFLLPPYVSIYSVKYTA